LITHTRTIPRFCYRVVDGEGYIYWWWEMQVLWMCYSLWFIFAEKCMGV